VATEAQIIHATRKINNALKSKGDLAKNQTQLEAKVAALQQELATVGRAAERAQGAGLFLTTFPIKLIFRSEEQRKVSQHSVALTEESLEEYRRLCVFRNFYGIH
jgi:structural maintenance of chromosome 1